MNTIHSIGVIALVLATLFVPQILAAFFDASSTKEVEEFDYDYR